MGIGLLYMDISMYESRVWDLGLSVWGASANGAYSV